MSYLGNPINSVAFLTDQFSGNGSTTVFTMSVAPATTSSILVAVSGVVQDPSTYSVVGTTLTFSAAPPSGTGNVSVRYLGIPANGVTTTAYRTVTDSTATAGQTTFSIPSYTVGYLNVYQNGVRLGAADFTATSGTTVVLAVAAAAGDLVTTESFYVSSVLNAIPATAGAVQQTYLAPNVAGTGPAFSAYGNTTQSVTAGTFTKVTLQTELFDTNSSFDSITNYRFQPSVAGYYQINGVIRAAATSAILNFVASLYKNGTEFYRGIETGVTSSSTAHAVISNLVYLNGSTDYIEMYGYLNSAGSTTFNFNSIAVTSQMSGALVRAT